MWPHVASVATLWTFGYLDIMDILTLWTFGYLDIWTSWTIWHLGHFDIMDNWTSGYHRTVGLMSAKFYPLTFVTLKDAGFLFGLGKCLKILLSCSINYMSVQGSTIRQAPGLLNFVPAVAYHFCLNMPAAFSQPGACLIVEPCICSTPKWMAYGLPSIIP